LSTNDAAGCNIAQPDFLPAGNPLSGQNGNPNIIFRIPTPVFGAGLIEATRFGDPRQYERELEY
jgi:hypothetical protein